MGKEKELDKLSLDMIECEKAGYGCHYGKWKAMQESKKPKPKTLPEGWKICQNCGKWYKPKLKKNNQKYCDFECYRQAQEKRRQEREAKKSVSPWMKTCEFCGREYKARKLNQKFCSVECYRKSKEKRRQEREKNG